MAKHFGSTSPRPRSPTTARAMPSPPKPPSMACTSCAPACPPPSSMPSTPCAPTKLSVVTCVRSLKTVDLKVRPIYHYVARVKPTSSCACSPTMSNGTCANGSSRCCSTTRSPTWPRLPAHGGGAGRSLTIGPRQSPTQTHRLGRACAQLPYSARRSGHSCQQPRRRSGYAKPFDLITRPTASQRKAYKLLGVPWNTVYIHDIHR